MEDVASPKCCTTKLKVETAPAIVLGVITFLLLMMTEPNYGFAIDEATYLWVAREGRLWFEEWPEKGWESLSREGLARRWHFLETSSNHPSGHSNLNFPLAMHLANLSWVGFSWLTDELSASRLGSMILFSLAVFDVTRTIGTSLGMKAGVMGGIALLTMPRMFGHAHFAATETPLSAFWLLTSLAVIRLSERVNHGSALVLAVLLSLTMSVKLTGWFLMPAVLVWLVVFRPAGWKRSLLFCVLLPPMVIFAFTPTLWHAPWERMSEYLSVARENPWKIPTYFMGECTTGRLEGWTGWVLLAVTTPVTWLFLGSVGLIGRWRDARLWGVALPFITLLGARTLGVIPTHDMERQFAPVWYSLAAMVAFGWIEIERFLRRWLSKTGLALVILFVAIVIEPVIDTWQYRGHGLMYFNRTVGGLAGADRMGFEVSYWWEGMTDEAWRAMLGKLPSGSTVFLRPDHPGLSDLQRWGVWRSDIKAGGPDEATHQILYAKRSAYFLPGNGDMMIPTALLEESRSSPMTQEVRFDGVRIVGER